MRATLLLALVAPSLLAAAVPAVSLASTATATAAPPAALTQTATTGARTRTATLAALTSSTSFPVMLARASSTTTTSIASRGLGGGLSLAVGTRAQFSLASALDLPADSGVDLVVDFGGWAPAPLGAAVGLFLRVGSLAGHTYRAPSGETWRRVGALGLGLYGHGAVADDLVDSDAVYFAPFVGGRVEFSATYGEWAAVPCATRLRDPACQRSVFAAETTRAVFAPHGSVGLLAAWWRLKITLLATVGVEFGTNTIRYSGLTTAAARAAFYDVAAVRQLSGVSLVGGLDLTVGIGSQLVREE